MRLCQGLIAAFLGLAGCAESPRADTAQRLTDSTSQVALPDQVCDQVHDFGVVPPGFVGEHLFVVENSTKAEWALREVVEACSCTTASLEWRKLAPGESGTVKLTYHAGETPGDDLRGVELRFQQTDVPAVRLGIKAVVQPHLVAEPREISWRAQPGERPSVDVQICSGELPADAELELVSAPEWISVELKRGRGRAAGRFQRCERGWMARVTAHSESAARERSSGVLQIGVVGDPQPSLIIPVQIAVEPRYRVIPSRAYLGAVAGGAGLTATTTVKVIPSADQRRAPPRPRPVGSLAEALRAKVETAADGWLVSVELTPPARAPGYVTDSAVELAWDNQAEPFLSIPVGVYFVSGPYED